MEPWCADCSKCTALIELPPHVADPPWFSAASAQSCPGAYLMPHSIARDRRLLSAGLALPPASPYEVSSGALGGNSAPWRARR
jgi:hypothetical protein